MSYKEKHILKGASWCSSGFELPQEHNQKKLHEIDSFEDREHYRQLRMNREVVTRCKRLRQRRPVLETSPIGVAGRVHFFESVESVNFNM